MVGNYNISDRLSTLRQAQSAPFASAQDDIGEFPGRLKQTNLPPPLKKEGGQEFYYRQSIPLAKWRFTYV